MTDEEFMDDAVMVVLPYVIKNVFRPDVVAETAWAVALELARQRGANRAALADLMKADDADKAKIV
jgi:hypothetical protein